MAKAKRGGSSSGGRWAIAIVIAAIVAGGIWIATQHPWRTAAPVPNLKGQALSLSKGGSFATVEQIQTGSIKPGTVVRLQAQLTGYQAAGQAFQLDLSSLVHSGTTITALIPAGSEAGNADDAALYDELRQDFALRFAVPTAQVQHPAQPTQVVVTGMLAAGPGGPQLRPVLDWHVQ